MPTQADSRVGGMQIQPFSLQKQAAVRTGVANAIGVQASDVSLDILTVFGSQVSPSSCLCCALEMLNVCSLASLNMSPPTLSPSSCAAHLPVYRTELVCWLLTVHLGESWGWVYAECCREETAAAARSPWSWPASSARAAGPARATGALSTCILLTLSMLPCNLQTVPHEDHARLMGMWIFRFADAACRPHSAELIRSLPCWRSRAILWCLVGK